MTGMNPLAVLTVARALLGEPRDVPSPRKSRRKTWTLRRPGGAVQPWLDEADVRGLRPAPHDG